MKPLIVLIASFFIAFLANWAIGNGLNFVFAGNLAMSLMLIFTALGHFKFASGMALMIPEFVPYKKQLVYITGIMEVLAAIGLLIPSLRNTTAILLVIFFVLILPANVNAAIRHIDFEKGNYEGNGLSYLWFRVPLQIFFIAWIFYFSLN
ncbi:hypothetical protein C3K47_02615 [Solitalea longa]|uniref:DoxX family protein n=1 Tax=Solitalea longa TaxID=2079460 RepID=A0A2S5A6U0_9SPHI|nr:hypothetical protein [Solitalea longa]POY38310.1 hypothetical protein C3K47_02615 [Solitalea longa]